MKFLFLYPLEFQGIIMGFGYMRKCIREEEMSGKSKCRRLKNLFNKNPYCFWCNCLVVLGNRYGNDSKTQPPNMATLDHVISRNNKNWEKGMKNRLVLSCFKCNQERQAKEIRELPIEELWHRSGRFPTQNTEKRGNERL